MEEELDYYARRASEELSRVKTARSAAERSRHSHLAQQFARAAGELVNKQRVMH